LCHVDDIEKEIEDGDDFTLRIMTAKDEISMLTTSSKTTIIGTPPPPSTNLATTPSTINSTSNPLSFQRLVDQIPQAHKGFQRKTKMSLSSFRSINYFESF